MSVRKGRVIAEVLLIFLLLPFGFAVIFRAEGMRMEGQKVEEAETKWSRTNKRG